MNGESNIRAFFDLESLERPAACFKVVLNDIGGIQGVFVIDRNRFFPDNDDVSKEWFEIFEAVMISGIYRDQQENEKRLSKFCIESAIRIGEDIVLAVFYSFAERIETQSMRAIVENTIDNIVRFDTAGRYIYVNPAVERSIGICAQEYLGKTPGEMNFDPEQAKLWQQSINEVVATKQMKRTEVLVTVNERDYYRDWMLYPEMDENEEVISIISTSRDFTEHRKERENQKTINEELEELVKERTTRLEEVNAELEEINALLEAEIQENRTVMEELDDLYNNAPIGYHTLDYDGNFLRINDVELEWLGYQREEILGKKTIFDLIPPEMLNPNEYHRVLETYGSQKKRDLEKCMICKDGSSLPVIVNTAVVRDEQGKIIKTRSAIFNNLFRKKAEDELKQLNTNLEQLVLERTTDLIESNNGLEETNALLEELNAQLEEEIAERATAQESLMESDKQLRRAIERAPVPILLFSSDELILTLNHACEEMSGFSISELPSLKDFVKQIRNADQDPLQWFMSIFNSQEENNSAELEFIDRSGSTKILEITTAHIGKLDNGRELGMSVLIDLTARRAIETNLIQARNEAETANKAKSMFLANMSHEIRTPLNGIIGMTNLLRWSEVTEEQKDYIDLSLKSSNILLSVVNDILDYSKIEAGMLSLNIIPFDLREVIKEVMDLFEVGALQKNIKLLDRLDENLPKTLYGDPMKLRQVLANLIGNAVKFTNKGEIKVSASRDVEVHDKARILFEVNDTGIGIAEEKLDMLFKSFSQVDSSFTKQFRGTGLGLAISKNLIQMMNGDINVASIEGVGSSFQFYIVLDLNKADDPGRVQDSNDPFLSKNDLSQAKVLLAEDDEVGRLIIRQYLEKIGYKVTTTTNGLEAFEEFKKANYQLVLMDLQMPVCDGFSATEKIRAHEALIGIYTPIIALTAYAFESDRIKCLNSGMDDYLSKPLVYEDFVDKVKKWTVARFTSIEKNTLKTKENS